MKDETPFAFAGIWDQWRRDGVSITSYAIITSTPNELLAAIHDRMPVILHPEMHNEWLNDRTSPSELTGMLLPFSASAMKGYPVSSDVNHAKIDEEHLVQQVDPVPEGQPSLF